MKSLLALKPYFIRYRRTFIAGFATIFLSVVFGVVVPILIRQAIDGLMTDISRTAILWYAILVVLTSAISGVFLYLTRQTIIVVSRRIENDLRNDFIGRLLRLSVRYYQNTPTGDVIAHTTNDIGAVRMFIGPAVMYSVETFFTFTIILALLLEIHPLLTLVSLAPMPFISFIVNKLGTRIHKRYEEIQSHFSLVTARAQESFSGARVVKSYRREEYEEEMYRGLSEAYLRMNLKAVKLQSLMMPLLSMFIGLSLILVLWRGGILVMQHALTLGQLTQFIIYLGILIWPMIAIGWVVAIIQRASASMKRLQRIMDETPEIHDDASTDHAITTIRGAIEFRRAGFRHTAAGPEVLGAIDLTIPAGSTLAIVGHVGVGKTTLVNLIPRFHDVTSGELLIDGRDIRSIPLSTLRRHIAYVTQETFLFSDTLAANIAYGGDGIDMDRVRRAAGVAQVAQDIESFPLGYDTVLGERGITLSGGQKQRVSLARAIYREPAILLLDDALSAVDTHTEERILQALAGVMRDRTSIIISHRISTVRNADHIIVLRNGGIAESGTHDELVALGGMYADLHTKQLLTRELEDME